MRIRLLRGAALAAAFIALGATACSSPLASCGLLAVATLPLDTVSVAVGDSTSMLAQVITGCPDKVGPAIDFSSTNAAIATVREAADSLAWITGVSQGQATIIAAAHDRSNIRSGIQVTVTAPTP